MKDWPIMPMDDVAFISAALGEPGSGRVRYGAAMALYRKGMISAAQLECYRIASADDRIDAARLVQERKMDPLPPLLPSPEDLIRALADEAECYIAKLHGPGIAEVRAGMARFRYGAYLPQPGGPTSFVLHHLPNALAAVEGQPALVAMIAASARYLRWITYDLYDRAKIGESFATSHAFCSIMGEHGAIKTDDFDLGLFLIAPHVLYRDHRHAAPELYAPLTGPHGWRFKPNAPLILKQAHEAVWNEANRPHLTKVGSTPFLCLYSWTRDTDMPAEVLTADDWAQLEHLKV